MKILVVDDDAVDLEAAVRKLGELFPEAELVTASNGGEGWALAQEKPSPALAVIDLFLHHLSGFELAGLLRRVQVPTVILTSAPGLAPDGIPTVRKQVGLSALAPAVRMAMAAA